MSLSDHAGFREEIVPTVEVLAKFFAEKITSPHNQHLMVRIVGSAGTGKSWAGLSLAVETAKHVNRILKGNSPTDYFDPKKNLAVINRNEIKRIMTNPGKYNILFLDDLAVAWNARRYKDDFNIFLNDIIQTFRPNNNLVIMTLQSGFLLDKVPRSLAHYHIEMEQQLFDYRISTAKVFEIVLKHRSEKIFYVYPKINGSTYVRYIFQAPDPELATDYENVRAEQLRKLSEEKDAEPEGKPRVGMKELAPYIDQMIAEFGVTQKKACDFFGYSTRQYREVRNPPNGGGE